MRKAFQILMVVGGAGMLMGNQKCQQKQETPQRVFKKIVELGHIQAQPIRLQDGSLFDFEFVANQQIYSVISENNQLAIKYVPPVSAPSTQGALAEFNLSENDQKMMQQFSVKSGKNPTGLETSKDAWCMVNLPQVNIAGSVNSFEMIGGGGISIGFTSTGPINSGAAPGASFNVEWAQLDLSMIGYHPLSNAVLAATNVTAKQTKTKVGFSFDAGSFRVGPSFYYQTPLASVTKKALTNAVSQIVSGMQKDAWYTRVMDNQDSHLIIVGGVDLNLEVGDQLLVYNEDYYWDGEPCNSNYLGGGSAAGSAVAKIELDWVGDQISRGKIIEQNEHNAVVGAKVKLFKFHDPNFVAANPGVQPTRP